MAVRAGEPPLDLEHAVAGSQTAWRPLVADDRREPLERLVRVIDPMAVVRVEHVIGPAELRQPLDPEQARQRRVRIGSPFTAAPPSVHHRELLLAPEPLAE